MKVLITGGNGQLGRDCLQCLEGAHQVTALGSEKLDITNQELVKAVLRQERPEVLINCAAYTAVDNCESDQARCLAVNGEGPAILAQECQAHDSRLIHISTDYVFDGNREVPAPYSEGDPTNPLSAYGKSKLAGEQAIAERLENHLIVRTAWLYGMGSANFLKTMLRLALREPAQPLKVVNDQFGSLTWTRRLAQQIEQLLETNLSGIVHATAEGFSSWHEGAVVFLRAMGIDAEVHPCSSAEYPTPAHRPTNSILDNSRLKEEGYNIMVPWQQDVEDFARQNRQALLDEARKNNS